jgi:hypothetical protein
MISDLYAEMWTLDQANTKQECYKLLDPDVQSCLLMLFLKTCTSPHF